MSMKGENVLDTWEEIDESELNSKLDQLKKMNSSGLNAPMKVLLMPDDEMSSRYAPPETAVKILRRPTQSNGERSQNDNKPKAPKKTLKQREQEYAEARLRILGSAEDSEQSKPENGISSCSALNVTTTVNKSQENIIRMPNGPDGTIGFNIRR